MQQPAAFWYVENDEDDQEILKEAMAENCPNVQLEFFSSGDELIKKIPAYSDDGLPKLIILDLNLHGLSGKDVLPIIRAFPKFDQTRIAILTTSVSPLDKEWAAQHGALFHTKPDTFNDYHKLCQRLHQYVYDQTETHS